MSTRRSFWTALHLLAMLACLERAHGQSNLLDNGDDLKVRCAVYGNANENFVDVTDRLGQLLAQSPNGFLVRPDVLRLTSQSGNPMSLLIFFDYDGHGHFYAAGNNGRKISLGLLIEAAKIDESHHAPLGEPAQSDGDIPVVFAVYGAHEAFWDVTDPVKKLLQDLPEGFIPHDADMGGDPEYGSTKALVVISMHDGGYHFFSTFIDGPKITKKMLLQAE